MQGYAPVPPGPEGRRAPRRLVAVGAVLGVLAVLVPLVWVTGGFEETPKEPVKRAGAVLDTELFDVTVRDVRVGAGDSGLGNQKERFLIVRMRVVNKGKETAPLGFGGVQEAVVARTAAGKWVRPDEIEGLAAGATTQVTQPGLAVEVSAMWKLGQANPPRSFTVGVRRWKYDHGFTDETYRWMVDTEEPFAGRLTLPVAAS
ncbi:hypothetical protein [Spirillospora albida]|uniref:hypothetical protein n=1 Tax=Spirillospora albida TaxID=58123 RepID=UPI0004C02680|nr:hypothetical protein [Spirillospora albida]